MKKVLNLVALLLIFIIGYSQQFQDVKPQVIKYQMIHVPDNAIFLDSIYIDTMLFRLSMQSYEIYDDFKNGNKIDINKFKICLQQAKVKISYTQHVKTVQAGEKEIIMKMKKPAPKISNEIQNVLRSEQVEEPKPVPKPVNREPASVEVLAPEEPMGNLTYVISDTMKLNEPYIVDLTLSKNMSNEQVIKLIDGFKNKELVDTLINITATMRARLIDPTGKNFTVTPITEEIQTTVNKNFIRWQWQIVPLAEGTNYLTINVDNYINDKPQSVNIYNGKTYVFTKHTIPGDIWSWIAKYWTYITYVLGGIGAIFAFIYKEKLFGLFKRNS